MVNLFGLIVEEFVYSCRNVHVGFIHINYNVDFIFVSVLQDNHWCGVYIKDSAASLISPEIIRI